MTNTYITNMFVDAMQNAKREWIKTWVKTDELAAPLTAIVDAQTAYTKATVESVDKLSNALGETMAAALKA